jgi:hypothetical protein
VNDEERQYFDARFETLTKRINDQFERVLDRLTAVEGELRDLRSEHDVARRLVTALPATVLGRSRSRCSSGCGRWRIV